MFISLVILLLYVCYAMYRPKIAVLACFPISMLFTTLSLFSFGKTYVGLDFALYLIAIFIVVALSSGLSQKCCPFRKALLAFVGGFMVVFFLLTNSRAPIVALLIGVSYKYIQKQKNFLDAGHLPLCRLSVWRKLYLTESGINDWWLERKCRRKQHEYERSATGILSQ